MTSLQYFVTILLALIGITMVCSFRLQPCFARHAASRHISGVQREEEDFDFADATDSFINNNGNERTREANSKPTISEEEPINPAINYLKSFYESIFFYGLDVEPRYRVDKDKKEEVLSSEGFKSFKRRSFMNPFFTTSELLALYMIEQRKTGTNKSINAPSKRDNVMRAHVQSPKVIPAVKSSRAQKISPRDAKTRMLQQKEKLQEQIDVLKRELKVLEITLATIADEDDEEDVEELKRSEQELAWQLEDAKIKLVTIEAEIVES